MLDLPGFSSPRKLYESSRSLAFRAVRDSDQLPVIIKINASEFPPPGEVARYRREFEILERIQLESVIRPLGLERLGRGLALITEDFGGQSLSEYIEPRLLPLTETLELGGRCAAILRDIHRQDIIHKDVKPRNILINPETGALKFCDFGIASQLLQEASVLKSPDKIQGTLRYMSPEQTGRMNRSIDYRSDFYSLGVTLFEMLTGRLPFESDDPIELAHCHIAVEPPPPAKINPSLPGAISDIVLKLLAKNPEDRYQSASGLEADLTTCLSQLQRTGRIMDFTPGTNDVSDQFRIPQKLYGREKELASLMNAFARTGGGIHEVVFVIGRSGIGKSALVQEIHKPITERKGYFLGGKFDQFKRNIPYSSVIQAFQEFIRQILSESEERITHWREKISDALGANGQLIIDVIPEVEWIIGEQQPVPELGPTESENRFRVIFNRFVRALSSRDTPLAIFLDDLQWADSSSLHFIRNIMTDPQIDSLFFIGSYRDNEVDDAHIVTGFRKELQKADCAVETIALEPLQSDDVAALLAECLRTDQTAVSELAKLVEEKTRGNPFFVSEFLKNLHRKGLIYFSVEQAAWDWNLDDIRGMGITDNVIDLMGENIRNLTHLTRAALQLAACIGNRFDLKTLGIVSDKSKAEAATSLEEALENGLLLPLDDDYKFSRFQSDGADGNASFKFLHDRVQQAAYGLIDESERVRIHYRIGRHLLEATPADHLEDEIFSIVNHLNQGLDLIEDDNERLETARLNERAGRRARESTAYDAAARYLETARGLLPADAWQSLYQDARSMAIAHADIENLRSNFAESDLLADEILASTREVMEQVDAYEIKIRNRNAQNQLLESLATARHILNLLGVDLPEKADFYMHVGPALARTKVQVALKGRESLMTAPRMTDPTKIAAMRIMMSIGATAYQSDFNLFALIIFRMTGLSYRYGVASYTPYGIGLYAMAHAGVLERFVEADYYGQLSKRLLERPETREYKCKVFMINNSFISHWVRNTTETIAPLREGGEAGFETGDLEYGTYCYYFACLNQLFSSSDLETVKEETRTYYKRFEPLQQSQFQNIQVVLLRFLENLTGEAPDPLSFDRANFKEAAFIQEMKAGGYGTPLAGLHLFRAMLFYFYGQYDKALEQMNLMRAYESNIMAMTIVMPIALYDSLIRLALCENASEDQRKKYIQRARANRRKFKKWLPQTPSAKHRALLLDAEIARARGKNGEAMELYDRAIRAAEKQENLLDTALAARRAFEFHDSRDRRGIAAGYFVEAIYGFSRWGSKPLVEDLREKHPTYARRMNLDSSATAASSSTSTSTSVSTSTSSDATGNLDLDSFVKASRAFAGEVKISTLMEKIMRILMENAGARRVLFLLEREGRFTIEAEGRVGDEQIKFRHQAVEEARDICRPIVNYVVRTREQVVLEDALSSRFGDDAYLRKEKMRSLLCMPVILQNNLFGMLYLEHDLATGVFTPRRTELLHLISLQAAIALENAKLYGEQQTALQLQSHMADSFSRFVPHQFLGFLQKESILDIQLGDAVQQDMAILFSDIRAFTTLSEQMTPQENFQFINQYLGVVSPAIRQNGGFIDKYIGDAVMALFPDAEGALAAALEMHRQLDRLNEERVAQKFEPIRIGIGIHYGSLTMGVIGETERMEGTVISDAVNLCARLESLTKVFGSPIIMSEQALRRVQSPDSHDHRFLGFVQVKGKSRPASLFEIFQADPEQRRGPKQETRASFEQAIRLFIDQDFPRAEAMFREIIDRDPLDRAARFYLRRAAAYREHGTPDDWQGAINALETDADTGPARPTVSLADVSREIQRKNYSVALDVLARVPNNRAPAARHLAALCLRKLGRPREARLNALRAVRGPAPTARMFLLLGKLYMEDKKYKKATAPLERACLLDPDHEAARQLLTKVRERLSLK